MFQNAPAVAVGAFCISPATHAAPAPRQRASELRCAAAVPLARGATLRFLSGLFPASLRIPSTAQGPTLPTRVPCPASLCLFRCLSAFLPSFLKKKILEEIGRSIDRIGKGATPRATLGRLRESREPEGKRREAEERPEGLRPASSWSAYGLRSRGQPTLALAYGLPAPCEVYNP